MTVRLTAAEARALGLTPAAVKPKRTTRKTARGPYHTRCCTCAEEFTTVVAEDRHVTDQRHNRFELVL